MAEFGVRYCTRMRWITWRRGMVNGVLLGTSDVGRVGWSEALG